MLNREKKKQEEEERKKVREGGSEKVTLGRKEGKRDPSESGRMHTQMAERARWSWVRFSLWVHGVWGAHRDPRSTGGDFSFFSLSFVCVCPPSVTLSITK